MKILKILPVLFLLFAAKLANAQFVHERDFKPITTKEYTNVDGSPYLYDTWFPGKVKLVNGATNKDPILLKYDLVNDAVYFKDKDSEGEMAFVSPVAEFTISLTENDNVLAKHYRSGYKDIEGSTPASFFEVLSDGKVQLLKKFSKVIFESQNIGSATKIQSFIEKIKYYLVINGKAVQVKNDKKSVFAALSDKQPQLEAFAKANKFNFKSDSDLGKLVDYYNSL